MTISIRTEVAQPMHITCWTILLGVVWLGFGCEAIAQKTGFDTKFKYKESITLDALNEPPAEELSLWYSRPAKFWEEALPLGNGRLGAMVYGGVGQEMTV